MTLFTAEDLRLNYKGICNPDWGIRGKMNSIPG